MSYLLLGLIGLLIFAVGWRLGNEFGVELRGIREGRIRAEKEAACCCERERKRHDEAVAAGLRRRKSYREEVRT